MSFSLDFLKIHLFIALGGGMFFHVDMKNICWIVGGERWIIEIFASGGHLLCISVVKAMYLMIFCLRRCRNAFWPSAAGCFFMLT